MIHPCILTECASDGQEGNAVDECAATHGAPMRRTRPIPHHSLHACLGHHCSAVLLDARQLFLRLRFMILKINAVAHYDDVPSNKTYRMKYSLYEYIFPLSAEYNLCTTTVPLIKKLYY